jgi:poly(A) polymerase
LQTHFARKISAERTRGALLRLSALLHDIGKPGTRSVEESGRIRFFEHEARGAEMCDTLMRRLRFSKDEIDIVTRTVTHHLRPALLSAEARVSNRAVYRFFRDAGDAGVDVCVLTLADQRARANESQDAEMRGTNATLLDRYYRTPVAVIAPPPLVDGRALMKELRLDAGPRVGELLEAIREAQAEGEVKTREEALRFARKKIRNLEQLRDSSLRSE